MAAAIRARASQIAKQVQNTVSPAYKWSEKNAVEQYKKLMEDNKQYVVKDPESAEKLLKQYVFTNLARIPQGIETSQSELGTVRQKFSNVKEMPLPELGTYALYAGELYAWFCVGEIVGRASGVAAAGAAVAFYFYSRRVSVCGFGGNVRQGLGSDDVSTHFEGAYQAPSTWIEALYFFAEALRYMYNESLGRWRSSDLLIGLAYLARQESANQAVADIAASGSLVGKSKSKEERHQIVEEFKRIAHFMKYCQALRERHMPTQSLVLSKIGVAKQDILMQQGFAGMAKPSFVIVQDHKAECVVLAIRGTHSLKDMFTSLTSTTKPHHVVSGSGVILGYCHFGMQAAARWVMQQTEGELRQALQRYPKYHLQIVGHSLGAGTAALLTMRLREMGEVFAGATCLAIACPACMTMELAQSCAPYITTVINGHDMIPTLSPGAADVLRSEVMQSSWYEAFRADMRSNVVVRAVEASLGGVGSVTSAASSWTSAGFSSASRSLRACYSGRGSELKRSNSDTSQVNLEDAPIGAVQFAKDWAETQESPGSPSWAQVLETLEPMRQRADEDSANPSSISGREPEMDLRASWPQSKRTLFPSINNSTATSPQGQRSPFQAEPLSLDPDRTADDSTFDSLHDPPPTPHQTMARAETEELLLDSRMSAASQTEQSGDAWDKQLDKQLGLQSPYGSPDLKSPTVSSPEHNKSQRRLTYPAGKIYHLVPARLVFGDTQAKELRDSRQANMPDGCSQSSDPSESRGSGTDDKSGPFGNVFREGVDDDERPPPGEDAYVVINTHKALGKIGLAPPTSPSEDFLLLQDVPQEMYGRIRLCKRMLADHFIPAYLGSLQTALSYVDCDYDFQN